MYKNRNIPVGEQQGATDYAEIVSRPFAEPSHAGDELWEKGRRCFHLISDSQTVVQIVNGAWPVGDAEYLPLFERVSSRFFKLLQGGLSAPRLCDDPLQWRPRRYNTRADAICNLVLDRDEDFQYTAPNVAALLDLRPNFLLYTDGGCRHVGVSAIGWIIYAVIWDGSKWCYVDLAVHGRRLDQNASSFKTEALAIDAATEMLMQILHTKL